MSTATECAETRQALDAPKQPDVGRTRRRTSESYGALVNRLSRKSVAKHFDAYADIAWDDPDYAIETTDPRWERTEEDALGSTDWYKSQPADVRATIGLHTIASHMKVGLEFEGVLKRGLLEFATTLVGDEPEFRYAYHEVIEEAQHSLMFQEFVNRSGKSVPGLSKFMRAQGRWVASTGRWFPELFFVFILGGEEPIDHVQRKELRRGRELHPLTQRIMQIHVTEEARHLCFAEQYLRQNVPKLGLRKRVMLSVLTPVILGEMAQLMMQIPKEIIQSYDIPETVVDAARRDPEQRRRVRDNIENVRSLCSELGLVTPYSRPLWKAYKIWPE